MESDNKFSLQEEYRKLNDSFKEGLAYGMGIHGGLFSEVNILVVTIVYCLHHKIKFVPHSGGFSSKIDKGWGDYFDYFCPEIVDTKLDKLNTKLKTRYKLNLTKPRRTWRSIQYNLAIHNLKRSHGIKYLSFDLWDKIYDRKLERVFIDIPQLNISGDFQAACRAIAHMVWKFNPKVKKEIDAHRYSLNLPDRYVGFQIRRGDKHSEAELLGIRQYLDLAESRTEIRNAFVLTDDFGVIGELEKQYPAWKFYTLCQPRERGYVHLEFIARTKEQVYDGTVQLMASVEILRHSELFIGTFSANPGMFLATVMDRNKTISIDVPFQIFGGKEDTTLSAIPE